jgi:aminoglycoside phosphotransferase (APT) family kinase protein
MSMWAEEDWERAVPPVLLAPHEVDRLLGPLGPRRSVALLPHGKANTNLHVARAHGPPVVLRIYQRDRDALPREQALWGKVGGAVPLPRCLGTATTTSGHPVAILDFVDGVHPAEALAAAPHDAPAIGRALGQTLAGLTAIPVDGPGLYAPDLTLARRFASIAASFDDLARWSLARGRARERLGAPRVRALLDALPVAIDRLAPLEGHPGLAHGDYKSSNLLLRPRPWRVVAVLDWEFARPFTPLLDVAILMRHRAGWPDALQVGFEEGMRSHGGWLPDDWREVSRVVDLMNLLGFLNASGDRPTLYAAVVSQIDRTLSLLA